MNIKITRDKLCIMPLNNTNIVPQPRCNFKDRNTRRCEDRCEGMAHNVRSNPWASLFNHVFSKRPSKIIAVPELSMPDFRVQNKGIRFQRLAKFGHKFNKRLSHGNRTLISVFGHKCRSLSNMKNFGVKIKPITSSFYDLPSPQTRIETTKKHEPQIIPIRLLDKASFEFPVTKTLPSLGRIARQFYRFTRIDCNKPLLNGPIKKSSNRINIRYCRGFRKPLPQCIVKGLTFVNACFYRRLFTKMALIGLKCISTRFRRLCSVTPPFFLICKKSLKITPPGRNKRMIFNVNGTFNGFRKIPCLKIYPGPFASDLTIKPIPSVSLNYTLHILHTTPSHFESQKESETGFFRAREWCAVQGLNLRPLQCQCSALPLS